MSSFVIGQRFVSDAEPDLGLGLIESIESRRVVMRFPASDTVRQYATQSAPIQRVLFRVGDEVEDAEGVKLRVEAIEEADGLVVYLGGGQRIPEARLAGTLRFSKPEERLLGGLWDPSAAFDIRRRTWKWSHAMRKSPARGFLGARIELIPHQLYIAQQIASRVLPRALLADEVGLGKTIEAGLIVHRLLKSARISRVLVLVPDSLVHQWWVEMFRRFHLSFTIVGEAHCEAVKESEPDANPFAGSETAIASLDWITSDPSHESEIRAAGWDLVVVDEAHHMAAGGPAYRLVEALSRETDGLLLLTATPEQLGEASHFARLHLLDPDRYPDYERYKEEARSFRDVAALAGQVLDGAELSDAIVDALPESLASLRPRIERVREGDEAARELLIRELLDRHGPGRVVFRNARSVLDRVPDRKVHPVELAWPNAHDDVLFDALATEFAADTGASPEPLTHDFRDDPRARWLVELLAAVAPEKVLVLCRFKEKAIALQEMFRETSRVAAGVFHEDLSLLQRDRNAAWFADEEDGAQVLVCSEIGSEGRNFQFAHHLVLFDLPLSPELLEQRIGRLYRIGQEHTVEIHVPFLPGTAQHLLFRWFHDGLDAFENSLPSGAHYEELAELARELALEHVGAGRPDELAALPEDTERLIERTQAFRAEVGVRLERDRDRLLELGSFRPDASRALVDEIARWDERRVLDRYVLDVLEHLGVELDEIAPRTFVFKKGNQLIVDDLPGLRGKEVAMTASRERATHQGELDFLTWDHPMVMGVMELVTSSEQGNSAVAFLPMKGAESLLVEAIFVLDVVAPPSLFIDRFLPPTPIRIVVDERLRDVSEAYPAKALAKRLVDARQTLRYAERGWQEELVPKMLAKLRELAEAELPDRVSSSRQRMREVMDEELGRLKALAAVNDHVRPDEIERLEREADTLDEVIGAADVRLDALRMIWRTPKPPEA